MRQQNIKPSYEEVRDALKTISKYCDETESKYCAEICIVYKLLGVCVPEPLCMHQKIKKID